MAELWFYHLEKSDLERALPPLLEKCLQRGWRAVVRAGSKERVEQLDTAIWTFREDSFVPHGHEGDPTKQPIWLTVESGNPNDAQALFLVDDAPADDVTTFERACLLFDGRDAIALESARSRWKQAKDAGVTASYWKESAAGRWEKQQ